MRRRRWIGGRAWGTAPKWATPPGPVVSGRRRAHSQTGQGRAVLPSRDRVREAAQVKSAFIDAEMALHPITKHCRMLQVSRPDSTPGADDRRRSGGSRTIAWRLSFVRRASTPGRHAAAAGIHAEFQAQGIFVSRGRVIRSMQADNLPSRQKRRRCPVKTADNLQPVAPNLLDRQCRPAEPYPRSAADTTYLRAW